MLSQSEGSLLPLFLTGPLGWIAQCVTAQGVDCPVLEPAFGEASARLRAVSFPCSLPGSGVGQPSVIARGVDCPVLEPFFSPSEGSLLL